MKRIGTTMTKQDQLETITRYASDARLCLKRSFGRRCPKIAAVLTELGRPVSARLVRRWTEDVKDVRRRNTLEAIVLLLGALYLTNVRAFDVVWSHLEAYVYALRGFSLEHPSMDLAFLDLRYRFIRCERVYFQGDEEDLPGALMEVDRSLKGTVAHLDRRD